MVGGQSAARGRASYEPCSGQKGVTGGHCHVEEPKEKRRGDGGAFRLAQYVKIYFHSL